MNRIHLRVFITVAAIFSPAFLVAQPSFEVELPRDQLACYVENQDVYLSVSRPIISFFVDLCPAISGEEAAALAQNSGAEKSEIKSSVLLTKGDFRCLLGKIKMHLGTGPDSERDLELEAEQVPVDAPDANPTLEADPQNLTFVLDCVE